jgi:hypothetical protein
MGAVLFRLFLTLPLLLATPWIANAKNVTIQGVERTDYFTTILSHALTYTPNTNYTLTFHGKDIPKSRVLKMIANKQAVDVIAGSSTRDRESKLRPIRIPLLKGMNGWRIPLVMSQDLLKGVKKLNDLQRFKAGQLHSWSDTKILASNRLPIVPGSDYSGLFDMLKNNRFDYFPRSVLEISGEHSRVKKMGIKIDNNIIIKYPSAYYFYVNKQNSTLAHDIEYGLKESLKDGSFDKIFAQYYNHALEVLSSHHRTSIMLKNPLISPCAAMKDSTSI